jgi:hypothetical protein
MCPSSLKSSDSQPKRDSDRRSARNGSPRGARARCVGRGIHVDELGCEVQHHRGLVGAAVHPHAALLRRRLAALDQAGTPGMGEERHAGRGRRRSSRFAIADQRGVAAVAVEEEQLAGAEVVATQRPTSSSTASSVVADSQIVPEDQACSLDFV